MTDEQRDTMPARAPRGTPMARRRFLTLAALGTAGVTWSATSEAAAAIPVRTLASPGLLGLLGSECAVRHLGEAYRQIVPAENDARILTQAILDGSRRNVSPNPAAALAEQIQQDFTHGRTVTLCGWVLAVTEARQCALYSLDAA